MKMTVALVTFFSFPIRALHSLCFPTLLQALPDVLVTTADITNVEVIAVTDAAAAAAQAPSSPAALDALAPAWALLDGDTSCAVKGGVDVHMVTR